MKVYGSTAIRNVAFVGHGAQRQDHRWWTRSPSCPAPAAATASSRTAPPSPTTPPTKSNASTPSASASAYAEWMDTKLNLIDTPGYLDFFGEAVTGLHAADAAVVVLSGDRRRRSRHREGLGGLRPAPPAPDPLRLPDGQGARRLRAGLRGREGAPLAQGGAGRDPGGRRPPVPRHRQPLLRQDPHLQEGHQDRRVRRGAAPRRVPGAVRPVRPAADRGGRLHRRQPARALPGRRGDPPRGSSRRHEEGDARGARSCRSSAAARTLTYGMRALLTKMVELFPSPAEVAAPAEGAAGRPGLQDHLRAARGRRHPVPDLHRRRQERRRGLERGAQRGREAEPPVGAAGQGADRGARAARRATSARWPSSGTPTPATPSAAGSARSGSRRFRSPRRSRPPR